MSRLRDLYQSTIRSELLTVLKMNNLHQAPKLLKVVLNVGVGDAKDNEKLLQEIVSNITTVTGQKPVVTKAKKSIAGFKIRAGQPIGVSVTLRGERMYDFIDKLVNLAFPRLRDFRGLSLKGFDGHGNYNLGIKEQVIFPEIQYDSVNKVHGLNVTIVTTAKNDREALVLGKMLGFPFEKGKE